MRPLLALLALLALLSGTAAAQDAQAERDRDFLTRLIEDNLSVDGTEVQIFGFAGALRSRARFDRLTIADADGIWLTIEDAELDWSRSALLRGSLEVAGLTAGRIALARIPASGGSAGLPRLTARDFALPDLPVAVHVDKIEARSLELGPAVLGTPVTATFTGAMALEDGTGSARLDLHRTDGREGQALIAAEYSNQTRFLDLTLEVAEAADGVVARLLDLPDRPELRFTVAGAGPLSDYRADIGLDTGGIARVGGTLRLDDRDDAGSQGFGLALAGDVAPLFRPAYRPFFGDRAEVEVSGVVKAEGGTAIDALRVQSDELRLDGTLVTAPDGLPESFRLTGALRPTGPDGALLPLPGPPLRIGAAQIDASYDAATGEVWTLNATVTEFRRGALMLGAGSLTGSGSIGRATAGGVGAAGGLIAASLDGIATGDPALDRALTDRLTADLRFAWTAGEALEVSEARVAAGATVLSGAARLDGASRNFRVTGQGRLAAPDLTVLAPLYGDTLAGAADAALDGWYEPLGGAFDLGLDAGTTALDLGPALPQRLLRGDSRFTGGLARSVDGITARDLQIETPRLQATLTGGLGTEAGQLALDARLADIAELAPGLSGPVTLAGTLGRSGETLVLDLQASGPPALAARLTGTAQADFSAADIAFDATVADLAPLLPTLAGPATASGTLALADDRLRFEAAARAAPGLSADLSGTSGLDLGDLDVTLTATLADLSRFVPQLPGPVEAAGTLKSAPAGYSVDLTGTALARADFALSGTTAADFSTVDLQLTGTAPLDLAEPFAAGVDLSGSADIDAALRGAPGLAALTGAVSTLDARIGFGDLALEHLAGRLTLDPEAMAGGARLAAGIRVTRATVVAPGQSWARLLDGPVAGDATLILPGTGPLRVEDLRLVNGDAVLAGQASVAFDPVLVTAAGDVTLGSVGRLSAFAGVPLAGQAAAQVALTHDPVAGRTELTAEGTTTAIRAGGGLAFDLVEGDGSFAVDLAVTPEGLHLGRARLATGALTVSADGTGTGTGALSVEAALDSLGRLVPQLPGPVRASGTVSPEGGGFRLDLSASGPGGIAVTTAGMVAASGTADLTISGTAPLGLANAFLAPALEVQGLVTLDLALNGPASVAALSGSLSTSGARAVLPGAGLSLSGIDIQASLAGGSARIAASAQPRDGGQVRAQGSLGLTAPYPVDMSLALDRVVYTRAPTLKTEFSGDLTLSGAILSGGALSGRIDLGETQVNLALGASGGTLTDVRHRGAPADVLATRRRAGLDQGGGGVVGGSAQLALDLTVSAPNRIFVRGRGLDAELGGTLRITGRTGAVVPIGSFSLIRGRLDILGRRLVLTEGDLLLQGSAEPTVRLVATTTAEDVTVQIVTEGAATAPVVSLSSAPDLPEDEILALLLFGRGLDKISAFQALQLANAVRTLLGDGGEGIVGNIRNRFGLDDLDVGTDADGDVAVRAGKYISENAYADVSVNAKGESQIQLNLDITPNLTARGRAGSTGETGLGLFFEKDY